MIDGIHDILEGAYQTGRQIETAMEVNMGAAHVLLDTAQKLDGLGISGATEISAAMRRISYEMMVHSEEMTKAIAALNKAIDQDEAETLPGLH